MSLIQPGHTSLNMKDVSDDLTVVHHHVRKLDINKRRNSSIDEPVLPANYNQIVTADDVDLVHHAPAGSTAISTKLKTITKTSQKIQFIKTSFHLYYTINLCRKKETFFSFF